VSAAPKPQGLVARNAVILILAQAAGMPLSLLVNIVMSRRLGPEGLAYFYLSSTLASFGFLVVEWGHGSVLGSMVANDHSRAGKLLGSSLVWRLVSAPVVYALLAFGMFALGRPRELQIALALVCLGQAISQVSLTALQVMRGFEMFAFPARVQVGGQVLNALFILPALLFGGQLPAALLASALAAAIIVVPAWRALKSIGVGAPSMDLQLTKKLMSEGSSFVVMGLVTAAQPNLDAVLLSMLAPTEVVGWHAAASKLLGVLFLPASAVVNALYPTLCRLWGSDRDSYLRTSRAALRSCLLLGVPLAAGCYLYADTAIALLNGKAFAPAAGNLRILGVYVLLVYMTWALGVSFAAAGKQRPWTIAQCLCVVMSAIFDPLLVPWFQAHWGNGGLGICTSVVMSEVLVLGMAVWIAPRGIFDRDFLGSALLTVLAGAAMIAAGWLLRGISPFLAAPISVLAYAGVLLATGGMDKQHLLAIRGFVTRRAGR
jgi:O-antigen/teichoic acid export membrane protein